MNAKKSNKKKEQGAETKEKLYAAAGELFLKRDFASVSIQDITDAVGITKGAFYVHFESKDALIALLIADHAFRADADYHAFLEALPADMPASQKLIAFSENIADVLTDTIGCENMKRVYQLLLEGRVDTEAIKGYNRQLYVMFCEIMSEGIARGEFAAALPAEVLARQLVMAYRGLSYEWCIRYPDFNLKKEAAAHFRILLEGLEAR